MEGLFSLGGGGGGRGSSSSHNPNPEIPPPETLLWYKQQQQQQQQQQNDDVSSYPNLELWNQQQQQQPQQILHNIPLLHSNLYSPSGVGPSMASINVSDDHSSSRSTFMSMSEGGGGGSCEDCGNQAKKDCPHMRCRTCCKNRGYECQTHLKSTWVPASKRRERQQQQQQQHREISKRPRDFNNNNNPNTSSALACTRLPSGLEQVNFPAVVSSPAEFRCVRVISMDDAVDQYAYQTAVNIGGHVFKGILYDQGVDNNNNNYIFGESSSENVAGVQHLNLTATAITTATAVVSSTGALVDPSSLYSAPLNTFMAASGTQFIPHTRS